MQARERLALAIGLAVALAVALFLLIEPMVRERGRLAAGLPRLSQDLVWMQGRLDDVRRLRAAGENGGESAPLAVVEVEGLLYELGLRARVRQVQSPAGQTAQLDLDAVDFGELAGFMLRVQEQGLGYVSGARIRRLEETGGMVMAELTLYPYRPAALTK